MEQRARGLGINLRNSSANYLPQEREQTDASRGESDQIQPHQTCEVGLGGQWIVVSGKWLVATQAVE